MRSSRLPLQISERKTLLIVMDGVLVNAAILVALRLGALRSGWAFTSELLLSRFYWFLGLTALYFRRTVQCLRFVQDHRTDGHRLLLPVFPG
jgi:hypothetical protein